MLLANSSSIAQTARAQHSKVRGAERGDKSPNNADYNRARARAAFAHCADGRVHNLQYDGRLDSAIHTFFVCAHLVAAGC